MTTKASQHLKHLRGTARRSRTTVVGAHSRLESVPRPPAALTDAARAEWKRLAAMLVAGATLTTADLPALRLLCDSLAHEAYLADAIAREGPTVAAGSGGRKAHPALAALSTTRSLIRLLLADFGLSPRTRNAIEPAPEAEGENPFAEFLEPPTAPSTR